MPKPPKAGLEDSDREDINDEVEALEPFLRPRRGGVCSTPIVKGYYKEPRWNKHARWERTLFNALKANRVFQQFTDKELVKFVRGMETHLRMDGEVLVEEGDRADSLLVVLQGSLACYQGGSRAPVQVLNVGDLIDDGAVLFAYPRRYQMKAHGGECIVGKLCHDDYMDLCTRMKFYFRERNKYLLKGTKMLQMMDDEGIEQLAGCLTLRTYEKDEVIITEGEEGHEFYVVVSGEVVAWSDSSGKREEFTRLQEGGLFGELACLGDKPRSANCTATTKTVVIVVAKKRFERMFGPMSSFEESLYLADPRRLIAGFFEQGDLRGPRGALEGDDPDNNKTDWFCVFRPTSNDAIAKMLSGGAVGKGLNVKGKSAKKGVLSGLVPFIQISDNVHKKLIEASPPECRVIVYYKTKPARDDARKKLQAVMDTNCSTIEQQPLDIVNRVILDKDDYAQTTPPVFGLDMPEPLMREAYIMVPDLTPVMGWETGRRSEPAFMDMNLHSIRGVTDPQVVLYQYDEGDSMNPRGMLIAYEEQLVKPVVSDFDTFTVGATKMEYEPLPLDQAKLMNWSLEHTKDILRTPDHQPWNSRWLQVLAKENERGFHPKVPKLGFGDPTSSRLIAFLIETTVACGAVRHGAECMNLYFPQELDEEYLVVWNEYPDKPWEYVTEEGCRQFITDRIDQDYACPINPVWPVRDKGWWEIMQKLKSKPYGAKCLEKWIRPEINYWEQAKAIHDEFPKCFMMTS